MEWQGNTFRPVAGWTVYDAIAYAINTAKDRHANIYVWINDIQLHVNEKSDANMVRKLYSNLLAQKQKMLLDNEETNVQIKR